MNRKYSILCIGRDVSLLLTRCEVLGNAGYVADWALPDNFKQRISATQFDLVILSANSQQIREEILVEGLPSKMKILALDQLMLPIELLRTVTDKCE